MTMTSTKARDHDDGGSRRRWTHDQGGTPARTRRHVARAREGYEKLGHEPAPSSPEELRSQVVSGAEKYGRIMRDANLKLE